MWKIIPLLLLLASDAAAVPVGGAILPLLGCTLTSTGTTCNRGSTTTLRSLPLIGTGQLVSTTLDGNLSIGMVLNSGTFTSQVECRVRPGDPFIPIAGSSCSASCIIPVLPTCDDIRVNVTACAACNISVYVLKD